MSLRTTSTDVPRTSMQWPPALVVTPCLHDLEYRACVRPSSSPSTDLMALRTSRSFNLLGIQVRPSENSLH